MRAQQGRNVNQDQEMNILNKKINRRISEKWLCSGQGPNPRRSIHGSQQNQLAHLISVPQTM